ncbi:MAG: putative alpha/beta-fold hydrolase [Marivirga sp.]
MPIIESNFKPKHRLFHNTHASTIYASLLRYIPSVKFERERLHLDEGDFLDLDWSRRGSKKLILILAGLEGKSSSLYSRALIRHFNQNEWDAVGMNYRGCSGQPNNLLKGYHMGASEDVDASIKHILQKYHYEEIILVGYSLGGNLALKYLGEKGTEVPKQVKGSVSFSVPMELEKSNARLNKWYNWHYLKWFMLTLNYKANQKKKQFPEALKSFKGFFMSGNFTNFDTHFTAPANGYSKVQDYWEASSSKPVLHNVSVPSLVINSLNDTFITDDCFPHEAAKENPHLYLEITHKGGHCGYIRRFFEKSWWMEERAMEFIQEVVNQQSRQAKSVASA